jgi:glutamine kinase
MINVVILGAGKPKTGRVISSLIMVNSKTTILDSILNSYSNLINPRFQFVGGYQFEKIVEAYPDLSFVLNKDWRVSGSLSSFILASHDISSDYFVTYSDIIYSNSTVDSMNENAADVVLCVDSNWRNRYARRSDTDIKCAERVVLENGVFKEITTESIERDVASEFCGLVKFSADALSFLKANAAFMQSSSTDLPLFHAINFLGKNSFTIDFLDVKNKWAELNQPADLAQYILGTKAEILTRLKPLLKKSLIGGCEYFSFKDWVESAIEITKKIQKFSRGSQLIIRSSALSEDLASQSNAGKYESILNVNPFNVADLKAAIDKVFESYIDPKSDDQFLVQVMLTQVKLSGVVMTRTMDYGSPYYVINYDISSSTDGVTSGRKAELRTILVSRNSNFEKINCEPFVKEILLAVSEIEMLLGDDSLDIEFAITKNNKVHIFQVRPIVSKAGFRVFDDSKFFDIINSIKAKIESLKHPVPPLLGCRTILGRMPDWNPAEIIGAKPNELARSMYEFLILDDIWAQQRAEYGYRDVRPTSLLRTLFGHVFVDVRASFNSFIPKKLNDDLACRLVEYYLDELERRPESHDKVEFDIVFTCYDFDLRERLDSLSTSGKFADDEVTFLYDELLQITIDQFPSSSNNLAIIESLEDKISEITNSHVHVLEQVRLLLHYTKERGTLPFSHIARNGFVATCLLRSLVRKGIVNNEDVDRFYESLNTVTHQMELDGYLFGLGSISKDEYLFKYGHLRPGTYDISMPSYAQNFDGYLSHLSSDTPNKPSDVVVDCWSSENILAVSEFLESSPLPWAFDEFDRYLRDAVAGREYAKLKFSKSLSLSLDLIKTWGKSYGMDSSFLSNLNINDILKECSNINFYAGSNFYANRVEEEENKKEIAKLLEFPNLIVNPEQVSFHYRDVDTPNFVTTKNFTGRLVVVGNQDIKGDYLSGAIVLIEQADPGYDWLFSKNIIGLITKYGGSNSHMTIRCSELSIPAAIGVGDVLYQKLAVAKKVTFDCHNHKIEVLS